MTCGGCSNAVEKALKNAKKSVVIEDSPALFSDEVKEAGLTTDKKIYDFKHKKLLEILKRTGKLVVQPEEKAAEAA
ncbi:hypothetical protein GGF48_001070 [Coemansia sp. RSA 921]|nr:hypothetical protein GGF48_001070 [Coemansia sp. RSA 921]